MTATLLPPAAKSTLDAVREGLADIRDRVSDMEALPDWDKLTMPDWDKVAHNTQDFIDRASGRRRRRPAWPFVALGVLAVIGIAVGVTMFMLNRSSMDQMAESESDVDTPWTPNRTAAQAMRSTAEETTAGSFPASDPMPSPMSPGLGS